MPHRTFRWLLTAVLVFGGFVAGGYFYLRLSLPQTEGELQIAGLDGPVEVLRDAHGIPHIFARSERDIVVGERGPREGERMAARRGIERPRQHVADHGAVPRNAHIEIDSRRALDLDRFVHDRERAMTVRRDVAAGAIELLEIEVLHVGTGIGCAPRDLVVAPDDDARHAGQRRTDLIEARRMQVSEVPDVRRAQPEMRIVGEQRFAARRART